MTGAATAEDEHAAGEDGRDEPLAVGASRQRADDQPEARQAEIAEDQVESIDGELNFLRRLYGTAIAATRRSVPKRERVAAIRALRSQLKAAVLAATTRRRNEQASRWEAARRRQKPSDPKAFH